MTAEHPSVEALKSEILAELEYLLTAAVKPGTVSHHDAEDSEVRLRAALDSLTAALERAEREHAAQVERNRELHKLSAQQRDAMEARAQKAEAKLAELQREYQKLWDDSQKAEAVVEAALHGLRMVVAAAPKDKATEAREQLRRVHALTAYDEGDVT